MKRLKRLFVFTLLLTATPSFAAEQTSIPTPALDKTIAQQMVQQSIQKFAIADDVSVDDAIAWVSERI